MAPAPSSPSPTSSLPPVRVRPLSRRRRDACSYLVRKLGRPGWNEHMQIGRVDTNWMGLGVSPIRVPCDDRFPGRIDRHSIARCLILKFRYSIPGRSVGRSLLYALRSVACREQIMQSRLGTPDSTADAAPLHSLRCAAAVEVASSNMNAGFSHGGGGDATKTVVRPSVRPSE